MEFVSRKITEEIFVPDDADYIAETEDILQNADFQSMKNYIQHGHTSCLEHCVAVSYLSYQTCKKRGLNARAAARGGLLHDMFLYDWHKHYEETGHFFHGYTHPKVALENAKNVFHLTEMECDIIKNHMWPLTLSLPRHKETFVVVYHDKICSLRETLGRPVF